MTKKWALLIFVTINLHASNREVSTLITPRSASVNAARELAGWEHLVSVYTSDTTYNVFAITPEVTLSFRPERIAQCFFGDDIIECENTLTIAGSQRPDRSSMAWLADYFGLPTDYESRVRFEPSTSNVLVDFDWYVGWDTYLPGLYFRIHAPIVYSRWNLDLCESFITTGSNAYAPGYFNAEGAPRIQLVDNFTQFIGGKQVPKMSGLTFHPLNHAKMACSAQTITRLSDIEMAFGWNVLHNEDYHLGGNIRCAIPTGNSPQGEFLFEPIVGNGHHWELGGGISTHIIIWDNEKTEEQAGLYLDANITHLFASDQMRSFDLCHKQNSRYMLAERINVPITQSLRGVVNGENIIPTAQFKQEVTPVANLTTLPVRVSCNVQADIVFMIMYTHGKNSWVLGYEFWGRSCDAIALCKTTPLDTGTWALKGDAHVFGFEDNLTRTAVPLSATQSMATINSGTNYPATGATTAAQIAAGSQNPGIDNPAPAVADSDGDGIFLNVLSQPNGTNQINTSIQPILLTTNLINIDSARTRGISNKLFSNLNHTITGKESKPYIGFGAEMEFGQSSVCSKKVRVNKKSCINTALSVWGVWIKGGVAF